jgi:DNA polymerase
MSFLSVDFETRSMVDLKKAGVYRYAEHWSTDVLCMAYAVPGADPKVWIPGMSVPPIFEVVRDRGIPYRAWNAGFEHVIWRDILAPRYKFPVLPMEIWVDTAAEAAALALPRGLGQAAAVLGIPMQKDGEGHKVMKKLSTPRCIGAYWVAVMKTVAGGMWESGPYATKKEAQDFCRSSGISQKHIRRDDHTVVWHTDPALLESLYSYCRQDVRTEMAIADLLRPLSPSERQVYLMTQRMNDRGVYVDMPLVDAAADLTQEAIEEANTSLAALTDGQVTKVTQTMELRDWLITRGVLLEDLRKDTVRDLLAGDTVTGDVRRVLEIRQEAGKTSTAKLAAFQRCVTEDNRAHGLLLYHAASTGRWGGRLIQPQNFPRPEVNPLKFLDAVLKRDRATLGESEKSVPAIVASMLRSMMRASPGHELFAADFSQVEARVLAWIAGQQDLVDLFATGGKVYETMAAFIFNKPLLEIAKDSFERQIGKNSVLGAGFQMGADRFAEQVREQTGIVLDRGREMRAVCSSCWKNKIVTIVGPKACPPCGPSAKHEMREVQVREDMAKKAIVAYRTLYYMIPKFWAGINDAAVSAVRNKGAVYEVGVGATIQFTYRGQFLYCRLPSGRYLAYAKPQIKPKQLPEPYQDIVKDSLTYMGVDPETKQWHRQYSYGGHLTENVVQAMARDLLAGAKLRVERAGYPPVLSAHDEVVCEVPEGEKDFDHFMSLVQTVPRWAAGMPLAADGWRGPRYRK